MDHEPRENKRMLEQVKIKYETALYVGDDGMWTVIEIRERPILKAPSQQEAERIIRQLKKAPRHDQ